MRKTREHAAGPALGPTGRSKTMTMSNEGCGCSGGNGKQSTQGGSVATEREQAQAAGIRPGLVDRKMTLLISAGAAMAGNCEPCLRKIVSDLKEAGVADDEIRGAVMVGQFVKEKPIQLMKEAADSVAGTQFTETASSESCPADEMPKTENFKAMMLIAAGAAMAANCEFCLNKIVPDLIEAGVSETDIRRAVEIGQFVKDQPAAIMKEAADILTGSKLSDKPASDECPADTVKQGSGCCG